MPEASASAPVSGGLPPGCAPVDLRSATGAGVDLTGKWAGTGILTSANEVALLEEVGGCVYGSVSGIDGNGQPTVTNLSGRERSDFTIDVEVVIVEEAPFALGNGFGFAEYSTMTLLIEWDDGGRLQLREDRERGETANRCIQSDLPCPDPVIWYRLDEAALP